MLAGTQIGLADGGTKSVEDIKVGDRVLSWDEVTSSLTSGVVTDVYLPFISPSYILLNGRTRMTNSHPALSRGRWVPAGERKVSDQLTSADGSKRNVFSLQVINESVMVYNFAVSLKTYVADGLVVHNKENCENYLQYCENCPPPR